MRQSIGIATQDVALYGELTARENLEFFGRLYGMHGPELTKRVDEVLEFTALTDRANDRVGTYSGGMKRRLNLGAAVVHRPRILYLDEPTTGVDPQSRNHIFEEVRSLNAAGVTVVYTSHYMEEVQALCPRIAILDHGRVIACDTRENLLRQLEGTLTVRVPRDLAAVAERAGRLPGVKVLSADGDTPHTVGDGRERGHCASRQNPVRAGRRTDRAGTKRTDPGTGVSAPDRHRGSRLIVRTSRVAPLPG